MIDISPAQIHGLLGGTDDPARRQAVSGRTGQTESEENYHSSSGKEWKQNYPTAIEVSINCTLPGSIDPSNELIR